jgi:hypothetical protein
MDKYAVMLENIWVEDIYADDSQEALDLAKAQHGENVTVEIVAKDDAGGRP